MVFPSNDMKMIVFLLNRYSVKKEYEYKKKRNKEEPVGIQKFLHILKIGFFRIERRVGI